MKRSRTTLLMSAALAAVGFLGAANQASATNYYWIGGGNDTNWSTTGNWSGGTVPTSNAASDVQFTTATVPNMTSNAQAPYTLFGVSFGSSATAYTLTGSDLSLDGTPSSGTYTKSYIDNNSSFNQTINNNLVVASTGGGGLLQVNNYGTGGTTLAGTISTDLTTPGALKLQTGTGTGALTVSGSLSGAFYQLSVGEYAGTTAATLVNLTGNNSTFTTTKYFDIWTGILELSNANALGVTTGAISLNTSGAGNPTLLTHTAMTVSNEIVAGTSSTAAPTGVNTIGGAGGYSSTYSGSIYLGDPYAGSSSRQYDQPLNLTADAGGTVTFSGNLLEPTYVLTPTYSNVTKVGAGEVILSGTGNSYLGTTEVKAGTLLVNGKLLTGGGKVTVDSGAILGGTGTIARNVAVSTGGILSPGDGVGTFTLSEGLGLANGSNLDFTLGSPNVTGGTGGNGLVSTTTLTLGTGVALAITQGSGFGLGVYHLIDYTGALTDNSSNFSGWTVSGLSAGDVGVFSLGTDGSANAVNLTVESSNIPEPAALGLVAIGGLGLLIGKRRRTA